MVFKKFEGQETVQIPVTSVEQGVVVGDLIAVDSEGAATKATLATAATAVTAGKKLYIIAQSDAVTEKTDTDYKSYKISRAVTAAGGIVVCYPVKDIEGLEE